MEKREPAKSFKDLIVWQKAHQLVLNVYRATKTFPKEEIYGLSSQIKRSSVSIAANIAEGFKKKGIADKLKFMNTAQGSLSETEYHLLLANDLEFFNTTKLTKDAAEVGRLLEAYMRGIRGNNS
ncbi:MAG: four helix bundle protein [Bacteroidota bacterium]|jgi:four helix bundle protein|nr:four helix bundle protein [Cytophagales bacterium]MCE2959048.1 four helix bundle protein [Flammeovirgaceae bacterium]MCZ8069820.1 four helix bundle protein [Cytophagales bacterium]